MRSLYWGVSVAMLLTLSAALLAFLVISSHIQTRYLNPVFEAMDELELEQARQAFDSGGRPALSAYMGRLDTLFGVPHHLLDTRGQEVLTGKDLSRLLPPRPQRKYRDYRNGQLVIAHQSEDGQYWFVAVDPREPYRWTFAPYYLLVIGVAAVLCWLAAVSVIRPLRRLTLLLDQFGRSGSSARLESSRRDEIGRLAHSFNNMADRIETLLSGERRLLEDISHELRSPLTRLNFAVRLAKTSPDSEAAFARIEREVSRITSLVSELLELTRTEGDPLVRRRELVALGPLVEQIVEDSRLEADARDCSVTCSIHTEPQVYGDAELLHRAVENVVRNAIRYAPSHSEIEVKIGEDSGCVEISVRDYGPGVPEAALERLFDPFFRVEEARDSASGGVGLGLSIARRAVFLHGGTISASNASPGLRVEIRLPAARVLPAEVIGSGRQALP